MKKILIAVPTYESIFPRTYESIYNMDSDGHWITFKAIQGYDVATARNNIAQMAIDLETDYVFMVDNDVVLRENTLVNLLDDPKDVCLGFYPHRDSDNVYRKRSCIFKLLDEKGVPYFDFTGEEEYTFDEVKKMRKNGEYKVQVHGGGMGCALIKTEALEKMKYPWFDWVNYPNRAMLSEDLYFATQCIKHEIQIYADTRVSCGHIFRHVQWGR